MWSRLNLKIRIYLLLAALIGIALSSGMVMRWYTQRMQGMLAGIVDRNLAAFETAAALETALVNQKGFVTYYFLDGDANWLRQLGEYRQLFRDHLEKARQLAFNQEQVTAVRHIADAYAIYIDRKDRVIALYKAGRRKEGAVLHKSVRQQFFDIIALCEKFKVDHLKQIQQMQADNRDTVARLRVASVTTIFFQMVLIIGLGFIFIHQILSPVHRMLQTADKIGRPERTTNVVTALSQSINLLIQDVDQAHHELEKSRENLLQAEKMALVGKLAAGMAHSIRNPFTSVKMRLFSLSRTLELNATQEEDFAVISQEIRHIDTIVQNFLEFSRPPKLMMQPVSPSSVVDNALQLLSHRLKSYGVEVRVTRPAPLPEVMGDPEQLKEVLVNLIINACEEMKEGGTIMIEERLFGQRPHQFTVLSLSDSGPGIPEELREKVFQPFFTTKDEGTGLGLSIASRIINEHGGRLSIESGSTGGAEFVITLPVNPEAGVKESDHEHHSGH
ncbi:MAG: ATP-binding protein [Desulfobacteraceae bacterium]|jgi:signal transduction histidine kinase